MKVLLTGATGFIGRQCLAALQRRGVEVCAVSSQPRADGRTDRRQADLLDPAAVSALVADVRATHLLHLAWIATPGVYWTSLDNARWLASSTHLLHAFQQHGGSRVVMAGTCAEYAWEADGICDEAATPLRPATLYGACKHALQVALSAFAPQAGMTAAWGRIFFCYGPHEHPARLVPSILERLLRGEPAPCSHGRQIRDFLFVEDVADAFVALLASGVTGPVNIASGEPIAIRDLVQRLAQRLDAEALVQFGARPAPASEPPSLTATVDRLRQEVGWAPHYTLDSGLAATIDWWRAHLAGQRPPASAP